MSDITNIDTCDASEAADDLENLSMQHAKRTGRYGESSTMKVAADWLRYLDDQDAEHCEQIDRKNDLLRECLENLDGFNGLLRARIRASLEES